MANGVRALRTIGSNSYYSVSQTAFKVQETGLSGRIIKLGRREQPILKLECRWLYQPGTAKHIPEVACTEQYAVGINDQCDDRIESVRFLKQNNKVESTQVMVLACHDNIDAVAFL